MDQQGSGHPSRRSAPPPPAPGSAANSLKRPVKKSPSHSSVLKSPSHTSVQKSPSHHSSVQKSPSHASVSKSPSHSSVQRNDHVQHSGRSSQELSGQVNQEQLRVRHLSLEKNYENLKILTKKGMA